MRGVGGVVVGWEGGGGGGMGDLVCVRTFFPSNLW